MITNIKDFIAERAKNPEAFKYLTTENFGEENEMDNIPAVVDNENENEIEIDNENEDTLTFDQFREMIVAEFERAASEVEEGMEAPEIPTDEQLNIIFTVVENLNSETPEETETETEDEEIEDEEIEGMPTEIEENLENSNTPEIEEIEEGVRDFFRGGSKEEVEAKKNEITERLKEIENKFKGKNLVFQEYGDNKTTPYNMADALKIIGKNNFLGTIQTFDKGDKIIILYKEGQKGANKIAAGTGAQTAGK